MYYWGKPQFFGVKAAAANIGTGVGDYTVEQFREDYPQGSPPRMRGKAPCRLFQLVDFGITPAYAGKSNMGASIKFK